MHINPSIPRKHNLLKLVPNVPGDLDGPIAIKDMGLIVKTFQKGKLKAPMALLEIL